MRFSEALALMKRGKSVERGGRTFKLGRGGIYDVTNAEAPQRVAFGPEEVAAEDFTEPVHELEPQPEAEPATEIE